MALLRLVCLSLLLPLAACRNLESEGDAPPERLEGTVVYLERMLLPPGAALQVSLIDPAHQGASVGMFQDGELGTPPFAFTIEYDPRRIQPGRVMRLEAEITHEGKVWFHGARSIAALPPAEPVELRVHRMSAGD